ncbi:MAG: hypothetical protein HY791_18390 [Deltaproteobacteria bacterium]|nr:hypothetical protein [Deltaproteobacteria bacterium]
MSKGLAKDLERLDALVERSLGGCDFPRPHILVMTSADADLASHRDGKIYLSTKQDLASARGSYVFGATLQCLENRVPSTGARRFQTAFRVGIAEHMETLAVDPSEDAATAIASALLGARGLSELELTLDAEYANRELREFDARMLAQRWVSVLHEQIGFEGLVRVLASLNRSEEGESSAVVWKRALADSGLQIEESRARYERDLQSLRTRYSRITESFPHLLASDVVGGVRISLQFADGNRQEEPETVSILGHEFIVTCSFRKRGSRESTSVRSVLGVCKSPWSAQDQRVEVQPSLVSGLPMVVAERWRTFGSTSSR